VTSPHTSAVFSGVWPRASEAEKNSPRISSMTGRLCLLSAPAKHVGPAGGEAGEGFADLQNMLFVNPRVHRCSAGKAPARDADIQWAPFADSARVKDSFFPSLAAPGTDHAYDGNQAVNFPDVAHAAQTRHGRAFNMVNRAGIAAGDHFHTLGSFQGSAMPPGRECPELPTRFVPLNPIRLGAPGIPAGALVGQGTRRQGCRRSQGFMGRELKRWAIFGHPSGMKRLSACHFRGPRSAPDPLRFRALPAWLLRPAWRPGRLERGCPF